MKASANKLSSAASSFFRNKEGDIVVMQTPNAPLIIWFIGLLVAKYTEGNIQEIASGASFGALLVWASLEIYSGVNYFRRTLGAVVLVFTLYSRLAS